MPDWTELAGAFGPVMALVIYMVMNKPKSEAKEDPAAKLVEEISAMKDTLSNLRAEVAALDGFMRGSRK